MPRYQQVVRQWRLLRRLERAPDGVKPATIADEAGTSQRNVYRDLDALQGAGFPIYNDDGRWFLTDTFRARGGVPLKLSEVLALRCARSALEALAETPLYDGFDDLVVKLDALLTPETKDFARQMDALFVGDRFGRPEYGAQSAELEVLRAAAADGHSVELRYRAQSGAVTERRVDPYHCWFQRGVLYLVGWCHLRGEVRMFSMARVESLKASEERFEVDAGFDFESFRRARFRPEAATYVRERTWHPSQQVKELEGGAVELVLETSGMTELAAWVLSFGPRSRVVEPEEL